MRYIVVPMIAAILQARLGSTRLPGKVLKPILGKPMLQWQIERLKRSKHVDTLVVATTQNPEDDAVAALAEKLDVVVFRGSENDVLDRYYKAAKAVKARVIVRVTGDCPLHDPAVVDTVIEHFLESEADYCGGPANYPEGLDTEVFSFDALERACKDARLPSEREHVTLHFRNHPGSFEIAPEWNEGKGDYAHMHWSVDTERDYRFVQEVFEKLAKKKKYFTKDDVLRLLDKQPDLLRINAGNTGREGLEKSFKEDEAWRRVQRKKGVKQEMRFERQSAPRKLMVVGCGSIGARHAKNARLLGVREFVLCDSSKKRAQQLARALGGGVTAPDILTALKKYPDIDAAIIATPSSMHPAHAALCIERGIPVFIEKPLGINIKELKPLVASAKKNGVVTMMGQSYRFHRGLVEVKNLLTGNNVGKIWHVLYDGGQYLPDWHPTEDYRKEYSARKSEGGGVLFTNLSHAVDTARWLFGEIVDVAGTQAKVSDLELEDGVDDIAHLTMLTKTGHMVRITFDFLDRSVRHRMLIVGSLGTIEADFIDHLIAVRRPHMNTKSFTYPFDANERYVEEMEHFFHLIEKKILTHGLDVTHGARVIEILTSPSIVWRYGVA